MPRPKKCAYEDSAKGKIESAFWTVLENEGFHSVTMRRLALESGLNRNTVYYHFNNVQEISLSAFNRIFTYEAGQAFIKAVLSGRLISSPVLRDSGLRQAVKKIHLFARSESPLLTAIVKESLKMAWFANVGILPDCLVGKAAIDTLKEIADKQH